MTKDQYSNYRESEWWKNRRLDYLSTHHYCERCGIPRERAVGFYGQDLAVHHRNYQRLWCEENCDLETTCRRCHALEHRIPGAVDLPNWVEYEPWFDEVVVRALGGWWTDDYVPF